MGFHVFHDRYWKKMQVDNQVSLYIQKKTEDKPLGKNERKTFSKQLDRMGIAQGNWWKIKTGFGKVTEDYMEPKIFCEDDRHMREMRVRRGRLATSRISVAVKMYH